MTKFIPFLVSISLLAIYVPLASAQTLIVGNKREHTVSFIDLKTGAEYARTKTGKAPHEVAVSPDGKTAVIVSYRGQLFTGNKLYVFDVENGKKKGVIALGSHKAPHGLKWIPGTSKVIATTEASQSVVVVDVSAMKLVGSVNTDQQGSHMVVLSTDNKHAFVANIQSGSFTVIDLEALEKVKDVKAGEGTEAIAVTPDGNELWVGNNRSKSIMVFDAKTFEKHNEIKTEGIPIRVEISPDGKHAAVSEPDLARVSIYEVDSRELVSKVDLSKVDANVPVTLLFSPDSPRLWVATTGSAKVVEIDTDDWSVVRSLNAGEGSDGLGFSPLARTTSEKTE